MRSPDGPLTAADRDALIAAARRAIAAALDGRSWRSVVHAADYGPALRQPRATFVTLHRRGGLRGCVGALAARQPLVEDAAEHACAAAFHDPRFPPLSRAEFDGLDVHVSILSPPEPLSCTSQDDLLRQVRPGIDGLIIEDGRHRATLLPSVWGTLTAPEAFVTALKRKAGLAAGHWSPTLRVSRYTVESVP
jgi:AmmeMemoRadiSam system protein A